MVELHLHASSDRQRPLGLTSTTSGLLGAEGQARDRRIGDVLEIEIGEDLDDFTAQPAYMALEDALMPWPAPNH